MPRERISQSFRNYVLPDLLPLAPDESRKLSDCQPLMEPQIERAEHSKPALIEKSPAERLN
jgi:hypothetical protein